MFHKHSQMKDGHLNKCSACVVSSVDVWRKNNPEYRKKEYLRRKPKLGITRTMSEYIAEKKKNAKGRRASVHEYDAKRRVQTDSINLTEFDLFVQQEAASLCLLREEVTGFKWHIDHIVPLNHKTACGLHNGFNLQVVPAVWNVKKGNRNMNIYFGC